jgi:hypothetical protein
VIEPTARNTTPSSVTTAFTPRLSMIRPVSRSSTMTTRPSRVSTSSWYCGSHLTNREATPTTPFSLARLSGGAVRMPSRGTIVARPAADS